MNNWNSLYRKKTHTDQYLHFESHHPLEHKISVICTLVARSENLLTEKCDKDKEMEHLKSVLGACSYTSWSIAKVQRKMESAGHPQSKMKKSRLSQQQVGSAQQVVIPYLKGLEDLARVYRSRGANVVCRPHMTLRKIMIHPKDKVQREGVSVCTKSLARTLTKSILEKREDLLSPGWMSIKRRSS